ncbi:MAG: SH3 domain-containing protein [Pseudomonadota bacterium]
MPTLSPLMFGAYGAALVATLTLAAAFTPAQWWTRPNARALAIVLIGTGGIGSLIVALAQPPAAATALAARAGATERGAPVAGRSYRAYQELNLRGAASIGAARLARVAQGGAVVATGAREGDWWQVTVQLGARTQTGWASSLWLRRAEEMDTSP